MRGLIVEGVTASGKSTLLRLLQRHLADEHPSRTKLFLSEHYTERILEDAKARGTLTFEQALSHMTDVVATLNTRPVGRPKVSSH
jgi:thymidylate kinase